MALAVTDTTSLATVPVTRTMSPTAGRDVSAGRAEVSTVTPRTTKLAAALPEAGMDEETRPSNSTGVPAVWTGRCLRLTATVAANELAGSAGAVAENTDTMSP